MWSEFKSMQTFSKLMIVISFITLIISLTQPAFYIGRKDYDAYDNSLVLFFFGWSSMMGGVVPFLIWMSNPIYMLALFFSLKNDTETQLYGMICSIICFVSSISFVFLDRIITNEAGMTSKITQLGWGYKLWTTSMFFMLVGILYNYIQKRKAQRLNN